MVACDVQQADHPEHDAHRFIGRNVAFRVRRERGGLCYCLNVSAIRCNQLSKRVKRQATGHTKLQVN